MTIRNFNLKMVIFMIHSHIMQHAWQMWRGCWMEREKECIESAREISHNQCMIWYDFEMSDNFFFPHFSSLHMNCFQQIVERKYFDSNNIHTITTSTINFSKDLSYFPCKSKIAMKTLRAKLEKFRIYRKSYKNVSLRVLLTLSYKSQWCNQL